MIWKNCTPWKNICKFSREVRDRPLKTKSVEVCYIVTDGRHAENSFKIIFIKFDLNRQDMDCFFLPLHKQSPYFRRFNHASKLQDGKSRQVVTGKKSLPISVVSLISSSA